jgi:hypothetical protein
MPPSAQRAPLRFQHVAATLAALAVLTGCASGEPVATDARVPDDGRADAGSRPIPDAGGDGATDASDAEPGDAAPGDAEQDATSDVQPDTGLDAATDVARDVDADGARDTDGDGATDAIDVTDADTIPDSAADAGTDAGTDPASDAIVDAASDPAADAAVDTAECTSGATEACYSGPDGVAGVGRCTRGERTCTGGSWGACTGWVAPASTEICGNDIDDTCDGREDEGCPGACGITPNRLISDLDNDEVVDLFRGAGFAITEPLSINDSHFAGTGDVVLVDALYLGSSVTPTVILDFVNRGGSAMFFATSLATTCTRIHNDNLRGTGLGLICGSTVTGPTSALASHPLTASMATGQFPTAFSAEVSGGTALATVGGRPIASVLEVGCGRLVVVGTGDPADSSYWPTTQQWWTNVLGWMGAPR